MKRGLAVAVVCVFGVPIALSANWPQWRGPQGTGTSDERNLPLTWSATENVAWRADLGGVGVSSPIVIGNHGDRHVAGRQVAQQAGAQARAGSGT